MAITFDASPLSYLFIVILMAMSLGGFLFYTRNKGSFPETFFLIASGLLIIVGRIPVLLFNRELNVDESQMLTQAMTLVKDPVYFRSVDGTTGGPLSSYFLSFIGSLLGTFDYTTAHTAALFLVLITLFFTYQALRNWFGGLHAAIGIFPAVLFYAFTQLPDFVHYTSEHFPIAITAIGLWMLSRKNFQNKAYILPAFLLGFTLTSIPFGKIQAVPVAAIIGLYGFLLLSSKQLWKHVGFLILGVVSFLGLTTLLLAANGVLSDFFTYYIQANFQYSSEGGLITNILLMFTQYQYAHDFLLLLLPIVALLATRKRSTKYLHAYPLFNVFAALLVTVAILAIARTGSGYGHYLLLLIVPISTVLAYIVSSNKYSILAGITTPLLTLGGLLTYQVAFTRPINALQSGPALNRTLPFTTTAKVAKKYLKADDYLVVWGWNCQYYVECQTPQGVAENHTIRSVYEHPMKDTYQARFVSDMYRNKPAVFIDATGPNSLWLQNPATQSYKVIPELEQYITTHYTLVAEPDGNRLFVRKDRVH